MDPVVILAFVLIGIMLIFRLRHAFRKSQMGNKAELINTKLEELRKKRDEE